MEGNNINVLNTGDKYIVCRDTKVRCIKRDPDDTEVEGFVSRVHDDKQHVDIRFGPLGVLSRSHVPIKFIKVL